MRVNHYPCRNTGEWSSVGHGFSGKADLILIFGKRELLPNFYQHLQQSFPNAHLLGCSTAGEISGTEVFDNTVTATLIGFDTTPIRLARCQHTLDGDSRHTGQSLAKELQGADLKHVFVLSDGLSINGTELVMGLRETLPEGVGITGGLAGDGSDFKETSVIADGPPASGLVAAIGFYGDALQVSFGSLGGWDPFGPDRLITRSKGNILYELDDQPALALYKRYLGEYAADLPASGLLFPLELHNANGGEGGLVRTILGVDEATGSMTFAGDVPEGSYARLMKANFDRLIDGATGAAAMAQGLSKTAPDLAVLISCVGRKLVLQQRVEEEVERVREVLGPRPLLTGFYSYGEISLHRPTGRCELHNQTMTITTFSET